MKINSVTSVVASILLLFATTSCEDDYKDINGMVWNTSFHITYDSDKDLTDSIYMVLRQVGNSLNVFDDSSVISRVNNSKSTQVDNDFVRVYEMSKRINRISGGAFDPTLGPLIDAWGFGRGHKATSDTMRIKSLLKMVGIDKTQLKNLTLIKENPRIKFNFSAIAKGYGCDRIGEMLRRNGVSNYLVEIGGEISCAGKSPKNELWRISIDKPIMTDSVIHESQCVIEVTNKGIATSGNYRNFHIEEGTTFGHTISAKTGRPVQTEIISATVVAPNAMEADGLATTLMALELENAKALARRLNIAALLILTDGSIWENEQFKQLTEN